MKENQEVGEPPRDEPRIILNPPQDVQAYWVYEHQLQQIEDGYGQVGQDFIFAVTSLSIGVSFLITLLTVPLSENLRIIFTSIVFTCAAVFLYTGIQWWRRKGAVPQVIARVRSRETGSEPVAPEPKERADRSTQPKPRSSPSAHFSWIASRKGYFLNAQQADVLPIHEGQSLPTRISFKCMAQGPYWRAGLILADEHYDPQRNGITDAVLIHLGSQPPELRLNLWAYVAGARLVDGRSFDAVAGKCDVRIDLNHSQCVVTIQINGHEPVQLRGIDTRRWSRRAFLAAWADGRDFEVVFEDIAVV